MRTIKLFAFICMIISCTNSNDKKNISNNDNFLSLDTIIQDHKLIITQLDEKKYKSLKNKIKNLRKVKERLISKKNGVICLPLENSTNKIFEDSVISENENQISYEYIGYEKALNSYIILVKYYETGEYMLINNKTGKESKLWGLPIISPNQKKVCCYGDALGYDVMPNGIQMYDYSDNNLIKEWEWEIEDWKPESVEWLNNNTLLLIKVLPKEFYQTKLDRKMFLMISW